jgi:hypothetical protein
MVAAAVLLAAAGDAALSPDHYRSSCPDLESIVRYEVSRKINLTVVTIPATLRLVFHDCMVGVRKTQRTLPGLDLAAAFHPVPPMFDSFLLVLQPRTPSRVLRFRRTNADAAPFFLLTY